MKGSSILLVVVALLSLTSTIHASCEGSVKGDPYFTGFQGQQYVLSGKVDSFYNLFSDDNIVVTVQIGQANIARGSGTVIKSASITYKLEDKPIIFSFNSDSLEENGVSIDTYNGEALDTILFNNQDQLFESLCMELFFKNKVLTFVNPTHKIEVTFQESETSYISGTYLDITIHHPEESAANTDGLLGQSASGSDINRAVADYEIPEDSPSPELTSVSCSLNYVAGVKKVVSASMKASLSSSCNTASTYFDMTKYNPEETSADTPITVPLNTNGLIGFVRLNSRATVSGITITVDDESVFAELPTYDRDTQVLKFTRASTTEQTVEIEFVWSVPGSVTSQTKTVTIKFCDCNSGIAPTEHPEDLFGETCVPPTVIPTFSNDIIGYFERLIWLSSGGAAGSCSSEILTAQCGVCSAATLARDPTASCNYCEPAGDGCVTADAPILMANGQTRRAADVKEGDQLMGNDGQPATVFKAVKKPMVGRRLVSINGLTPFFTPDHPWVNAEDSTKYLVADVLLSNINFPMEAAVSEQLEVGSKITQWNPSTHAFESTLITSIAIVDAVPGTPVYLFWTVPQNPGPGNFFAGFSAYGFQTAPGYYDADATTVDGIVRYRIASAIKDKVNQRFAESGQTDLAAFCQTIAPTVISNINAVESEQFPVLPTKYSVQLRIDWTEKSISLLPEYFAQSANPSVVAYFKAAIPMTFPHSFAWAFKASPDSVQAFITEVASRINAAL